MRKFLVKVSALLAVAGCIMHAPIAYAAESESAQEELVVEIPEAYLKMTIPDKYIIVLTDKEVFRGNLEDYGVDIASYQETLKELNTVIESTYIDGDYTVNSFLVYDPDKDTDIDELSTYTDEQIKSFADKTALGSTVLEKDGNSFVCQGDGVYRDKNGIGYACMSVTYPSGEGDSEKLGAYCLCTVVNGELYYFYTKGDDPSKKGTDYKEVAQQFVEGVTFDNAPDKEVLTAAQSNNETVTVEEMLEQIKNRDNSDETYEDMVKEQQERQETANLYYRGGRLIARIAVAVIFASLAGRKVRKAKVTNGVNYGNRNGNGTDDYLDRF